MTRWVSHGRHALVWGISLFGLWMVFVDNTHEAELVTGAVVAGAAALLDTLILAARRQPVRVSSAMLRYAYRPWLLLISDTVKIIAALGQTLAGGGPVHGRFRAVRYEAVADNADCRARRILTEWGASLGANRYVIGIDAEARYLLVHELTESSRPLDPMELG